MSLSESAVFFQVNAILEAFGHAKTPMNTNSSRFIKLLSLQYSEKRKTVLRGVFDTFCKRFHLVYLVE